MKVERSVISGQTARHDCIRSSVFSEEAGRFIRFNTLGLPC